MSPPLPDPNGHVPKGAPRPNLSIYIPNLGSAKPAWELHLRIPPPPEHVTPQGTLYIEQAASRLRNLPLRHVGASGARIAVRPQTGPYQFGVSDGGGSGYECRLTHPIAGLNEDRINAFHYSINSAKRVKAKQPLYWGRGYYLVWHRRLSFGWPPLPWNRRLQDLGEWCCAEVELPESIDYQVRSWAWVRAGK